MIRTIGIKSKAIKAFKPIELGISENTDTDFNIQLRQNYFQISRIPFWPTNKSWALEKKGQIFTPPESYLEKLDNINVPIKTSFPWFAFTGFYVFGLLSLLFFVVFPFCRDYNHYSSYKKGMEEKYNAIDHFKQGDFIHVFYIGSDIDLFLKVKKATPDSVLLDLPQYPFEDINKSLEGLRALSTDERFAQLETKMKNRSVNRDSLFNLENYWAFGEKSVVLEKDIWVKNSDLKNALGLYPDSKNDYEKHEGFHGVKIPHLYAVIPDPNPSYLVEVSLVEIH